MRKGTKIFLFICAGLVGSGILLTGVGVALGGRLDNVHFGDRDLLYDAENLGKVVTGKSYSGYGTTVEPFHSVEVDADAYNVVFVEDQQEGFPDAGGYSVFYEYKSLKNRPVQSVVNGVLKIEDDDEEGFFLKMGDRDRRGVKSRIEVHYPTGTQLQTVEIDVAVGTVDVSGVNCQRLDVDIAVGEVLGTDITSNGMSIENSVGSVELEGTFTGVNKLDCAVGEVIVSNRLSREQFSCNLKALLGSVTINGIDEGMSCSEAQLANHFYIRCSTGSIEVNSTAAIL